MPRGAGPTSRRDEEDPLQRGLLLGLCPLPLLLLRGHLPATVAGGAIVYLAPALSVALLLGGLLLGPAPRAGRSLASVAVVASVLLAMPEAAASPLRALVLFVVALGALAWLWRWTLPAGRRGDGRADRARGSAWGVVRSLAEQGAEVIAVDARPELVQAASRYAEEAICVDAAEEGALEQLAPSRRDVCVCAIGDESREGAIIVSALLRQLGAPRVIARATDDVTRRILELVGAHEVVHPERAFGERLATRMLYDLILDELPLGPDLVISNIRPPSAAVGRTLIELELPRRFGVTVVAIKSTDGGGASITQPDPSRPLRADDTLVVVSKPGAVHEMAGSW